MYIGSVKIKNETKAVDRLLDIVVDATADYSIELAGTVTSIKGELVFGIYYNNEDLQGKLVQVLLFQTDGEFTFKKKIKVHKGRDLQVFSLVDGDVLYSIDIIVNTL